MSHNVFNFLHQLYIPIFSLNSFKVICCRFVVCGKGLSCNSKRYFIPFQLVDIFWRICRRRLLKTVWQKDKLLIMSNCSFCHSFQLYSRSKLSFFEVISFYQHVFKNVYCRFFECGKRLTLNFSVKQHEYWRSIEEAWAFTIQFYPIRQESVRMFTGNRISW